MIAYLHGGPDDGRIMEVGSASRILTATSRWNTDGMRMIRHSYKVTEHDLEDPEFVLAVYEGES